MISSCKSKLAIAMHYTAFVPYSVTAGCSLTGNTHRLLHVLCCLWLPSDPGIFPSATIVLLGICYDPILSKLLCSVKIQNREVHPTGNCNCVKEGQSSSQLP